MKKKTQSLSERQNSDLDIINVWKMQDKYLDMTTGQLFEYMRKKYSARPDIRDMIPDKDTGNEVIGKTIQHSADRIEEEFDSQSFEMAYQEMCKESDMLFALLILPFIGFVLDAGYIPEKSITEGSIDIL